MSDSKKIGFDILENSDMSTIEEIGTDKMNIDKNARDRMLNISLREYEAKKKKLGIRQDSPSENSDMAESVTGVEAYDRRKLPHIIYIALCSAAAIALTFGSISMFSRQKNIDPDNIKPIIAEATSTDSKKPASDTSESDSSDYSIVTSEVTGTETTTTFKNTTTAETTTTAAVTETTAEQKPSDTAVSAPYKNPHTDRTDITQEELEAAAVRAVKGLIRDNTEFQALNPQMDFTFSYAFYDVNEDSVPELFVTKSYVLQYQYMYVYDGNEYVIPRFNGHDLDGNEKVHEVSLFGVDAFTEKNTIGMSGHQGGDQSFILYMDFDNTITPLYEYAFYRYYKNGILAEEHLDFDEAMEMSGDIYEKYNSYERVKLNWKVYTDINGEE